MDDTAYSHDAEPVVVMRVPDDRATPFDSDPGTQVLVARSADGEEDALWMELDWENDTEHRGVNSYAALITLTLPEYRDSVASDVDSPSYAEMDELRDRYRDQLDAADTDTAYRIVLAEMWREAEAMELTGHAAYD